MVDWNRIRELRDEIGDEDYAEVMDLFFIEVDAAVERLARPGTAKDREADMHFLKGSAANLGFATLGSLCSLAEQRALEGTLGDEEVQAVIDCYQATRAAFKDGCAEAARPQTRKLASVSSPVISR